ncbi:WW domain-binding protein 1-like [Lineus longissimus]|uniref:WW domain-binding protein 1-like n=1 Tax=Lineus longissimus TaxID=88925 RepID=UPI00315D6B7A
MAVRGEILTLSWSIIFTFTISRVSGYYCDSGRCGDDEYCCGLNICCTSYMVWQNWYFWCGLVFFLIMLSACASFWRYRYMYYRTALIVHAGPSYRQLNDESDDPVHHMPPDGNNHGMSNNYAKYSGQAAGYCEPPPYSTVALTPKEPPPPYTN